MAGGFLHANETQIKTNRKLEILVLVIKCPKTKAIVNWLVKVEERNAKERFPLNYYLKAIRTNSLASYYPAIRKVLGYRIKHVSSNLSKSIVTMM